MSANRYGDVLVGFRIYTLSFRNEKRKWWICAENIAG